MLVWRGVLAVAAVVVALAGCGGDADEPPPRQTVADGLPPGDDVTVREVVDGDTIVVDGGRTVRLIGVDTPETRDPSTAVECFGPEASAYTADLLPPGTLVRLVGDTEPRDAYERTLAYVHRAVDGLFVNAALVRDGYAEPLSIPPNDAFAEGLDVLAAEARAAGWGLWDACADAGEDNDDNEEDQPVPVSVSAATPLTNGVVVQSQRN